MSDIDKLRDKINDVDQQLVNLLAERRKLSRDVIQTKDIIDKPIRDQNRESELLDRVIKIGKSKGIDSN
ncbi:MAG: chorismate mutase, partial [Candidatus Pacebacteria bacterium]|nr:chorismate mutase [Candidatus Paceibacterota bacterium]